MEATVNTSKLQSLRHGLLSHLLPPKIPLRLLLYGATAMIRAWLSIAELAERHQTTHRALRFYEQQGLLAPDRTDHRRRYSIKDSVRLELIIKGKRLGFTLNEIKKMIDASVVDKRLNEGAQPADFVKVLDGTSIEHRVMVLSRRRMEIQSAIEQLQQALARWEEKTANPPPVISHDAAR